MATTELLRWAVGEWAGISTLFLPWLENEEDRVHSGESRALIELQGDEDTATIKYTWAYKGGTEVGTLIIAADEQRDLIAMGMMDTFHLNGDVMRLTGPFTDERIDVMGTYFVGDGEPEWGWKIQLSRSSETLRVRAMNVSPEGEEEVASEAEYHRIG